MDADVVIYEKTDIPNKLLLAFHPQLSQIKIQVFVSSPPVFHEFKQKIRGRRVIILGSGFASLFSEIVSSAEEVSFILRPEDTHPDTSEFPCNVENWFIYWNQITPVNPAITEAVYNHTYRYPRPHQRNVYRGLLAYGVERMNPIELDEFLLDAPTNEKLRSEGNHILKMNQVAITSRLQRRRIIHVRLEDGLSVPCAIINTDHEVMETGCQAIEQTSVSASIIFYLEISSRPPKVFGRVITAGESISALEIAKACFPHASGSKYVSFFQGTYDDVHKMLSSS